MDPGEEFLAVYTTQAVCSRSMEDLDLGPLLVQLRAKKVQKVDFLAKIILFGPGFVAVRL